MASQHNLVDDRQSVTMTPSEDLHTGEVEKSHNGKPEDEFPDGGWRAWGVAIGNAGVMFCTLGHVNTWGVYQAYYEVNQLQGHSPSAIAWIGSLQSFSIFAAALAGGPLFDRYGAKVIVPAAVVYLFSVFMTSLCKEYWQFMLAQGVLGGMANGFTMSPSMAATPQYFKRKRGAAMGVAVAGSSLGGVILPIALNRFLTTTTLGFGWSVRILGFIMLGVLVPSCLLIRARLPPRKSQFLLHSAFKELPYALLVACMFFLFLGMFPLLFLTPSFAIAQGMSTTLAFYTQSILNAASFPGRIVPAILSDRLGRQNVLAAAGLSSGILALCWQRVEGNAGIIVFAVMYGFCSGAIISGGSVSLASCPSDPKNIGTYMGMGMGVSSIAALIGPPISGALVDRYHGFAQVADFCGVVSLFGGVLALMVKVVSGHSLLSKS
ncbi:MCT family MFS transporter [Aspergillus clavatus NRRL 1]|uniref:Monocarboxylate permease, putative n=1 Tax=Aspergillus clavatus (strain ATCC 1007 / CBS 513.65 / DSM 816 / NCTC 3887 / NRRL 1 / QM 1276 / 107) TaxID=344612 RepID=A1CFF5_ASPCL|nr:monocarboxylate permease, putative [Aspergillus clavatus NRRL 1]EAW11604.1 monocarboxylate permease, putative [Aspergillus clavatus NRRL 1]